MTLWLNGQSVSAVSAETSYIPLSLERSAGLFETMLVSGERILFLAEHLQRLSLGLRRLSIELSQHIIEQDIAMLEQYLGGLESAEQPWRLKYAVWTESGVVHRQMSLQSYDRDVRSLQLHGVRAITCKQRLHAGESFSGLKLLNRDCYQSARAEWHDDAIFEGLMLNQQGAIIEGTISNVFAVVDSAQGKKLITPPLTQAGVDGITRQLILKQLSHVIAAEEAHFPSIDKIDELFLCNSLLGIVPIVQLDQQRFSVGDVTQQLQQALASLSPL